MNWLLVIILWGRTDQTMNQIPFQTKFLCEKALDTLDYPNHDRDIPVGLWARCVQVHKVDRIHLYEAPKPTPTPKPVIEQDRAEEVETSNG